MGEWSRDIFAKNLRFYMERSGRSQKELAEIAGVSAPTFNEWINAKKYPRIDKIQKLADYFGILKSDLIEDKPEPKPSPAELPLSEGEAMLIQLFRRVPEDKQRIVLEMIKAALNSG